ncbi:MAG: M16 family metallopeptidase [Thermoanaerobaculia bacterium]
MKSLRKTLSLSIVLLAAFAVSGLAQVKDWRDIKKPPLRPLEIQQPKRIVFPNGMIVFLQESRELPLISGNAVIRGGSREEPAEKTGLVNIYGEVWRTGGTKTKTGDQLDDFLEARAAKVETGGDIDSTSVSFDTLKGDFDPVFAVFVELLRQAEFREEKIEIAKQQMRTGIARRNDASQQIAARETAKLVYGGDSPYARVPEYATVSAIKRDDLVKWHKDFVHPNNIILGISGDFDAKSMEAKLRKALATWPKGPQARKADDPIPAAKPGVYIVSKDDVTQSEIRIGHIGVRRDNPDFIPLEVMNEILGGSMSSRLFSSIRTKQGLAYAVGGGVGNSWDHPGVTGIGMGTKSGQTAHAIEALLKEVELFQKAPPTDFEMTKAKDTLLNSYVFRYDSREKVLHEQLTLEFYGYPADFYKNYQAKVEKVTPEDVARVARQYINPKDFVIFVVGKESEFDKPLTEFGPVSKVDISIPEGTSKAAVPAAAASTPEGTTVATRIVKAYGGESKVKSINALRRKATILAKTPQGEMEIELDATEIFPDRSVQVMKTPMGEMTMIASPAGAFMKMGTMTRDLPGPQKDAMLKEIPQTPIFILGHADTLNPVFTVSGKETIADVNVDILDVNVGGALLRWYVDAEGRILRIWSKGMEMGQEVESVNDFSDYRAVDGMQIPYKVTMKRNGEDAGAATLIELQINPTVDPKTFEKPAPPTE